MMDMSIAQYLMENGEFRDKEDIIKCLEDLYYDSSNAENDIALQVAISLVEEKDDESIKSLSKVVIAAQVKALREAADKITEDASEVAKGKNPYYLTMEDVFGGN